MSTSIQLNNKGQHMNIINEKYQRAETLKFINETKDLGNICSIGGNRCYLINLNCGHGERDLYNLFIKVLSRKIKDKVDYVVFYYDITFLSRFDDCISSEMNKIRQISDPFEMIECLINLDILNTVFKIVPLKTWLSPNRITKYLKDYSYYELIEIPTKDIYKKELDKYSYIERYPFNKSFLFEFYNNCLLKNDSGLCYGYRNEYIWHSLIDLIEARIPTFSHNDFFKQDNEDDNVIYRKDREDVKVKLNSLHGDFCGIKVDNELTITTKNKSVKHYKYNETEKRFVETKGDVDK